MRTGLTPLAAKQDEGREQGVWRRRFGSILTELAIWLPLSIAAGHVVLFTAWTTWVSFTASSLMPDYTWVGLRNYWAVTRTANFQIAYVNLVIFGFGFVLLTMALGLLLAILLDPRVRGENVLRTIFITVFVILLRSAITSFDLVRALTGGGPGISTMLPTLVVYDFMFQRSELGRGSAAAVLMLLSLVVVMAPYGLYVRWQRQRQARACGGRA